MEEIKTHQDPSIRLKKNARAGYSWEIVLSGEDTDEILKRIETINKTMKDKFGGND